MTSAALGVINDARGRQHRRVLALAATAACAVVVVGLVVSQIQGPQSAVTPGPVTPVAPTAVLARAASAGVACRTRACDSVGLAIWLRRAARSVTATIAGHSISLTTSEARPYLPPGQRSRTMVVGYLTRLRLVTHLTVGGGPPVNWPTRKWPDPAVTLRINYGGGRVLLTRLHVTIQPGWG